MQLWPAEVAALGEPDTSLSLDIRDARYPARRARSWAYEHLLTWGVATPLADDVVLVVSELVTNAALHAPPARSLWLRRTDRALLIAVTDSDPAQPCMRGHDGAAETGRGLQLVTRLADYWGSSAVDGGAAAKQEPHEQRPAAAGPRATSGGKLVWCAFMFSR